MKIALLHAYSANNSGDGLLLDEAIELLRETFGGEVSITVVAMYPETFEFGSDMTLLCSRPSLSPTYFRFLRLLTRLSHFDLVVGVGGGYLRFRSIREGIKTAVIHLPQLFAAAMTTAPSIYLPQSVGPSPRILRPMLRRLTRSINCFAARDDRTIVELPGAGFIRVPDMALLAKNASPRCEGDVHEIPVLSVRGLDGTIPPPVWALAAALGTFDGYVQSTGAGNDDTAAMASLGPQKTLTKQDLLNPYGPRRVVIAVRLHAALMALNAGHYVIHLAYERKGFGAFSDIGLDPYVHSVRSFSPSIVREQSYRLQHDPNVRLAYDQSVEGHRVKTMGWRVELVARAAQLAAGCTDPSLDEDALGD